MNKGAVDRLFPTLLAAEIATEGFTYMKASKWFVRPTPDLVQIIGWTCHGSSSGQTIEPDMRVRSDEMTSLLAKVRPISAADERFRTNLGVPMWRLPILDSTGPVDLRPWRARGEFTTLASTNSFRSTRANCSSSNPLRSRNFTMSSTCWV